MKIALSLIAAGAASLAIGASAHATTFSFVHISAQGGESSNSAYANQTAQQLFVDITDEAPGQVRFTFRNEGPLASSITGVYFDDGHLMGVTSVINGGGVNFLPGGTPANLPGGNSMTIPFSTTVGFLATSSAPTAPNGVNPGEWVAIIVNLINGATYDDVIADMGNGALRIGLRVQAQEDGESDAFINNGDTPAVPLPAGVGLALAGLIPLAIRRRRAL